MASRPRRSSRTTPRSPGPARPTTASTGTRPADRIVADLEAMGDLAGSAPHEMVIGRCQRSNDVVEPRLKTQWFIRTGPLAERALASTREGRTRILPDRFEKTWEHWMTTIRDWNVSRQLWWGHRIPAWYCPDGHVTVSAEPDGPRACEVVRPAGVRAAAGPGHLRYVVQLGALAVLDARLAGRHGRPGALLPDIGHGDRLRHHLLLGRPDDDAGPDAHGPGALPHGLPVRAHPRSGRPEDVQDQGQRRRSARRHRRVGRRRPAVRPDPRRGARDRPAVRRRRSSRTPATSRTSSGTRRGSSSAPGRHRSRRAPNAGCPTAATRDRPSAGSCPAPPRRPRPSMPRWPTTRSPR